MGSRHQTSARPGRRRRPAGASAQTIRARRVGLVLGLLALVVVIAIALGSGGGGPRRLVAGGGGAGGTFDPLAYDPAHASDFAGAAAAGLGRVIYVKSPGGIVASARRTEGFAAMASRAAAGGPADAATLEAIVMLESAGRPDVIAGPDPSAAAGLTQIVAGTATQLLGMRVDLRASRRLGAEIATAAARNQAARVTRLSADRARVDQRFDPAAALAATERYLKIAKGVFGRDDLAVESYHMGIGNLETAIRRYVGGGSGVPIARLVSEDDLSYARLYFDSTPIDHPSTYAWLAGLGDDSATYLWRVMAAGQALTLYRGDPAALAAAARLQSGAPSAELVLRGPGTPVFADRAALTAGRASGAVVDVPSGARAASVGLRDAGSLVLRPEALATLLYMAAAVRAIAGPAAGLGVTAANTDTADLQAAGPAGGGRGETDRLDASGWAFDIARVYSSPAEALAFQFVLDRLSALNLIAWDRSGRIIHVVVGPRAGMLGGVLKTLLPGRA